MQVIQQDASFSTSLKKACEALSIEVSNEQEKQLLLYLHELLKWNKTYNLTAIRDPEQALIQHLFDSLSIVPALNRHFKTIGQPPYTVLDVGSGAGLPGIVLAIIYRNVNVTCVDTVEKKITFIKQMASVLSLSNLDSTHNRVEQMSSQTYDIVTSRAFASLEDFATLAGPRACVDGVLLAMKGKHPDEEIKALHSNTEWQVNDAEPLTVPQLDAERCLLWIKRKKK